MNRLNKDNAYALLIGVGADLAASVTDATAINNVLVNPEYCGYKEENIYLLTEKDAGKYEILAAMDELIEKTDEDSSILVFYSGHGGFDTLNNEEVYFLQPNDFYEKDKKTDFWVSYIDARVFRDKLAAMKSKQLILLLDCCHAAGMTKGGDIGDNQTTLNPDSTTADVAEKPEALAQEIDNNRGMVVLSSCREDQLSWIQDGDVNSLFTKCLLEALKAEHQRFFEIDHITALDAANYIFRKVPERQPNQQPYMNVEIYDNFVLTHLPDAVVERMKSLGVSFDTLALEQAVDTSDDQSDTESEDRQETAKTSKVVTSFRETEGANNLLLFVHGFSGEASDTFGIIPELLAKESKMDGWDMRPLGFTRPVQPELGKDIWAAGIDIDKIALYLSSNIKNKFKNYDRIAIVAHSLGGLAVQKAILDLKPEQRDRISHLIMFGTPSKGIDPEQVAKKWNNKYKEMSGDGPLISKLRADWSETFKDGTPFKLKVAAATDDDIVSVESCHGPFSEDVREYVDNDHFRMVKPADENDDAYSLILNTLTNNEFSNQFTNKEEINLLLGKYDLVVKDLLPRLKDLDKKGIRQLIFALEGLDRQEEAVKILNEHPVAKDNSDLIGILGGRHKREYLKTYSEKAGQASVDYYSKALKMAMEAENKGQIYYHAINLAFMSIVKDEDEDEMIKFAEQALEAAEASRNNLWKYATVAEANMYLDNMDKAKEYYEMAAEMADIRQKISMHTNAYKGYVALMQSDNPQDDFIKFLKAKFLS